MELIKLLPSGAVELYNVDPRFNEKITELKELGCKEFIKGDIPVLNNSDQLAVDHYEERDGKIFQTWTINENPPAVIERKIAALKAELSQSDYKIIKSYEQSLVGVSLDYDVAAIHAERQRLRDKINELNNEL